jgi:hypothetical protein
MSSEAIRPTTLEGIKRLAKSLKVERGVQHVQALDVASQAAGFQNFRHASNALRTGPAPEPEIHGCRVFLTAYWEQRESGASGRETLTIWVSSPWTNLITPLQLKNHRALAGFRKDGPDHLVHERQQNSQSHARNYVCAAARVFYFMDATKLQPSQGYSRVFPGGDSINAIPGHDHDSVWYDRKTRRYLFADEPYEGAAEGRKPERESWAKQHGFVIVKPEWAGMYAPDIGSRLYLVADKTKGIPLSPVAASLNMLPAPIDESTWNGESTTMKPSFVSPGTAAMAAAVKDNPQTPHKLNGQRNSVEYVQTLVGPRRRPVGRMPIESHAEIGRFLKSVLVVAYKRKAVYKRINSIRCELDEWVQREYSDNELPSEQFNKLYYKETGTTFSRSITVSERKHHAESLAEVKEILGKHYPDCSPLRTLLKKVDAAVKSLTNWT